MKKGYIYILGLDIGGANTKAALIKCERGLISHEASYIEYFPFWQKSIKDINQMLKEIIKILSKKSAISQEQIDYIAISITAELSDAFYTKREGIFSILESLKDVFPVKKLFFITTHNQFIDYNLAKKDYIAVAAANWVATALYLGNFVDLCILIDAGSTTIDVIPLKNSIPITIGKDDTSRLINHELIYTGGLRATIPSITHFVPYKNALIRISFERFALISDVHRILNNITDTQYINETADNRSTSLEDCYARLARIICSDLDLTSKRELDEIAQFIYQKQIELISSELSLFMKELQIRHPEYGTNPKFIITGLSAEFLIKRALKTLNYNNVLNFEEVTNIRDNVSSSAFAVAGALYLNYLHKA